MSYNLESNIRDKKNEIIVTFLYCWKYWTDEDSLIF